MNRQTTCTRQITAVIVIMCFLVSLIPVVVNAANEKPADLTPLYVDDFMDGTLADNIDTYRFYTEDDANADTLTEGDGKLVFERKKWIWNTDANYGEPAVRFYPNADHGAVSGKIFTEFKLAKTREVVRLRFCDSKGNYITQIAWEGDKFSFGWRDSTLASQSKSITVPSSEVVKISWYADVSSTRPRYSMWINDELQVDNGFSVKDLTSASFSMFQIYTLLYSSYSKPGTFTVSDFGIYQVNDSSDSPEINLEDEQNVDSDLALLTEDKILSAPLADGYLIDALEIDTLTKGMYGSDITWSSTDEDIISTDGKLTRPDADTDVTVTASVNCGTVTKEKEFSFKVAGKSTNANGIPGDLTPLYYDSFSDGEIAQNISTDRFYTDSPADTLEEKDGDLVFTREKYIWYSDKSYGEPAVRIFGKEDKSSLTGKLLLEYTLAKTRGMVRMRICDTAYNYLTQIYWHGNSFAMYYCDEDYVSQTKTLTINAEETVKVSVYADFSSPSPTFSVWVNNEKQLDNVISCNQLSGNFSFMQLYTLINDTYPSAGTFSVDNAGIYRVADDFTDEAIPVPPVDDGRTPEEKVAYDLSLISDNDVLSVPETEDGYIIDPLDIDTITEGESGSSISWKSSHNSIISVDGKLTRPQNDTEVTVTATAEFGDAKAEKTFTYMVAGLTTDIDGMITNRFPIYYDDFSDGAVNERIKTRNMKATDKFDEKNGKLILKTTSWASHEPGVMFFTDNKETVLSGDFIMEYTVSKTCDVVRMRTNNAQWNYLNQIYWVRDNFNIFYRDSEMQSQTLTLNIPSDSKAKVTIYTNITGSTPKFTMWVNNKKVLDEVYSCVALSPANVKWLQLYAVNHGDYGKVGDTIIDNFGYYDILPEMEDSERVRSDYDALTDESLIKTTTPLPGYAFEDLNMPEYGKNGSRITWYSSDESVISNGGTVTRAENENVNVTLTADIEYGSAKLTRTFNLTVLGKHVDTTDVPTVESMIMENDFESPDTPNKIATSISGAGSVGVENGVFRINKTDSGNNQVAGMIYTGTDEKTVATGVIGLEFDIERQKSGTVQIRSIDANGNLYYSMVWGAGGMSAYYATEPTTSGASRSVWLGSDNKIHVNMMFDTANSTYWLWINGQAAVVEKYSRSVGTSAICYTMFYLESINDISIDNYKVYHAVPPKALRLKFDDAGFDEKQMLSEIPQAGNIIKSDLNLPTELRYGTSVKWQSSRPDIIDPDTGKLTRPVGVSENPKVIVTANMENSGITSVKNYEYYVLRDLADGADIHKEELNDIKVSYITDEDPAKIRKSLNFMDNGIFGSPIRWSSSNTSVITNSGRVIRPRFDEPDATVTVTASIGNYSKDITFTVLADEPPKDPMHTSDEEFFGVWNGTSFTKGPQLDYSLEGLSGVMACAKAGDYAGAKQALYEYFKVRNVPSPISLGTRQSGWVDARADGMYELGEESAYWKGHMVITSDDYEPVTVSIHNASALSKAECKTLELIARYNECTSAFILGTGADNPNMIPKLEVTVNGAVRSYTATESATIRAGSYSRTHIDNNKELQAKMFGDFLGDETYRILLAFDLSDISADDKITAAQLTVYARKSSPSAADKHLWVIDNRNKAWSEDEVFWAGMNFVVHNYNGLIGGCDWKAPKFSDVEFAYQMPRFGHSRNTMTEYKYTGNEKYAYAQLGQVMDIITDFGDKTPYPRSLDAGLRMHQWVPLINTFKDSPYFTAEFATAFMKYMYSQFEYFPTRKDATGNWREYEQLAVLYATSAYPELANSASAKATCIESWENAFKKSFLSDGTYIEDTGGYHRSSFAMYRDFKKACVASNTELPAEFDETLHKAVYYMTLTYGSGGYALQFGDEGAGKTSGGGYSEVADWYNDNELRFVDSLGKKGTEPAWTSYQFPEGRYTMMRSGWDNDDIYLHTSVRGLGGGGHGHHDDNSIILIGNGKRLLVDAGKFTYNTYDPARMYGRSTQGHNTVVINDNSQRGSWTSDLLCAGTINSWATNSEYDYLSQTTISYADHDHTRSILFIKDGLLVVSDLMEPHDKSTSSNYKQYWHMMPEAGITADDTANALSSNYQDGKELLIVSADDTKTWLEDGYYDISDGSPTANKAGIFEIDAKGDATLDTVLYVTNYKDAEVTTERINTGKPASEVTSIKVTVQENGTTTDYYYVNNYVYDGKTAVTFGDYVTDARAALIGVDKNGDIISVSMTDGSFITKNSDTVIDTTDSASDIYASFTTNTLSIVTSDTSLEADDIEVVKSKNVTNVSYNGTAKEFNTQSGVISVGSENAEEVLAGDNNKHDGIGEKPSSGGSSGGGGSAGGGAPGTAVPVVPQPPVTNLPFTDISGHWAADYITDLHAKSIVNGNPDGTYRPDNAITRSEFVAIAIRAIGADKALYKGGFADVSEADWFAADVQTAVELGIISADTLFRPGDNITRQEMAKILTGCAKYRTITEAGIASLTFDDASDISEWAVEFVEYAVSNGLMNGKGENVFDPHGIATRAETATVFSRLIASAAVN